MNDYYFTYRSVTAAMQDRQLLDKGGVAAVTVRTPMELRQQGCGYSLRLAERMYGRGRALLDRAGGSYQRIYQRRGGQWREVRP